MRALLRPPGAFAHDLFATLLLSQGPERSVAFKGFQAVQAEWLVGLLSLSLRDHNYRIAHCPARTLTQRIEFRSNRRMICSSLGRAVKGSHQRSSTGLADTAPRVPKSGPGSRGM